MTKCKLGKIKQADGQTAATEWRATGFRVMKTLKRNALGEAVCYKSIHSTPNSSEAARVSS